MVNEVGERLALAAVAALIGKAAGFDLTTEAVTVAEVRSRIKGAVRIKRIAAWRPSPWPRLNWLLSVGCSTPHSGSQPLRCRPLGGAAD